MSEAAKVRPAEISEADLQRLDTLWEQVERHEWELIDYLVELYHRFPVKERHGKLKLIAQRYIAADGNVMQGRSYVRITELVATGEMFPKGIRDETRPLSHHEEAKKTINRIQKTAEKEVGKERANKIKIDPRQTLNDISRNINDRRLSRSSTKFAAARMRKKLLPLHIQDAEKAADRIITAAHKMPPIKRVDYNSAHFGDYVKILEQLPPDSIKMIHADAPYLGFTKRDDGKYDMSVSSAQIIDCANADYDSALETTKQLFEPAKTRLRKHGTIPLWQWGGAPCPEIFIEAKKHGFMCFPIIWQKPRVAPGDQVSFASLSCEICYVFYRESDGIPPNLAPDDSEFMSRKQIWQWDTVRHNSAGIIHWTAAFEKPRQANQLQLHKLTVPGDLVFDAFGCSGFMCVDAHQMQRRWIYCEMHPKVFKWGYSNLVEAGLLSKEKAA